MPVGRDTGLQVVHYLARTITGATPLLPTGISLGDVPQSGLIVGFDILVTAPFSGPLRGSFNADLSAPFLTVPLNSIGFATAQIAQPAVNLLKWGRLYIGVPSPPAGGSALVVCRFLPRVT